MPQCVPLQTWQHQLGCTWVIMCAAKSDCSAQLTQPCDLSQDLLLSLSPTTLGLYLPPHGTCRLTLRWFLFWKCMENVCLGVAKCFLHYQRPIAYKHIQKHMLTNTFLFIIQTVEKNIFLSLKVFICYLFTARRFKKEYEVPEKHWLRTLRTLWFSWTWKYFCVIVHVVPDIQLNSSPWCWPIAD